jgi:hypothetical protein
VIVDAEDADALVSGHCFVRSVRPPAAPARWLRCGCRNR